ncbi:aldehyde dehydrogenase family protein [Streptomyces sp. BPTC-684]|uniref:aldehyde dehydrogenase family protein n=1 Tax=Streptomyces sp. BPTC-684 TaxID=3043734 RepID=UPI0024B0A4D7|nr:aldehyde dehydrogenase family protein [Streptomyces sp. BPTC-684]WHM37606.1 aldehyde dehydrogenase family protein [Streptomyces sp. BPTC-684]
MTSGPSASDAGRELYDPATGQVHGRLPDSTPAECAEEVRRAARAFDGWYAAGPRHRADRLHELADAVHERRADFVELERRGAGKPVARIGGEVDFAVRSLRWFAGQALRPSGETHPSGPGTRAYTDRIPLGVCAAVVPSNYPLLMAAWKVGGALAYGNTAVVKPAPETPLSVRLLVELGGRVLPGGVLGAVYGGAEVGRLLCALPEVAAVSFTGSTAAGREVAARCAESVKRVSLELGGKNPLVVFPDADLEAAAAAAVEAFTGNSGQMCVGASRLIVHESVHDDFVREVAARAFARRVGPTDDPDTELGPLITRRAVERVASAVEEAVAHGVPALLPPGQKDVRPLLDGQLSGGYYVSPAVLDEVPGTLRAWREELFGPVLAVRSFRTEEQALALTHDTEYGLSASVWTADGGRIERFARRLRAGMLWFNTWGDTDEHISVGGIGQSGYGRELGVHAAEQYTHTRAVWIGHPAPDLEGS